QVGAVEAQLRVELVAEVVTGAATAGAGWVAALDHETVDDAVEDGAVVERTLLGAGCVGGLVFLGALGQADEVVHGLRGVVSEEVDGDVSTVGVQDSGCGLQSHGNHYNPNQASACFTSL